MSFSSALLLTDLDDFITPSQNCIKPVRLDKTAGKEVQSIEVDEQSGSFVQINRDGSKQELQKTKIELSDCLACSGCVTSAESVLVNQQSVDQLLAMLERIDRANASATVTAIHVVFSISPQSVASIAAKYDIDDPNEAMRRIVSFLKGHMSARYVFDTTWSRHFALLEMCEEFVQRYQQQQLPLLTSACPGWICYAEKTHHNVLSHISTVKSPQQIMGSLVKDHFSARWHLSSSLPPPQSSSSHNEQEQQNAGAAIYHVSVMPCFDKKLEGAREDFRRPRSKNNNILVSDENGQIDDAAAAAAEFEQEVDMVITTTELEQLLQKKGFDDLKQIPPADNAAVDSLLFDHVGTSLLFPTVGQTGSGAYLETVFRYAALKLFGRTVDGPLEYKTGRNDDFKECWLEVDGQKVLHFALAYGFRNIQNIVRKMSSKSTRNRLPYHFVEVMACPSGCLNGGGQIPAPMPTAPGTTKRDFLHKVERIYKNSSPSTVSTVSAASEDDSMQTTDKENSSSGVAVYSIAALPKVAETYHAWIGEGQTAATTAEDVNPLVYSEASQRKLHTRYHAREKIDINPLAIKW